MSQPDGSVLIDTEIDTSGAVRGLNSLEISLEKSSKKINSVAKSFENMLSAEGFVEIDNQIKNETKKLNKLIASRERFLETGGSEDSTSYKKMQYDIDELSKSIEYAKAELASYDGVLEKTEKLDAAYMKVEQRLEGIRAKEVQVIMESERLKSIGENAKVSNSEIVNLSDELGKLLARQKELQSAGVGLGHEEFDRNSQKISEINAKLREYKGSLNEVDNSVKKVNTSLEKTEKRVSSANWGVRKMLLNSLLMRAVFSGISAIGETVRDGTNNLVQYSGTANKTLSTLKSSLTQLKNSFATAFVPLLTVVTPILTKFLSVISKVISYIGMFISALTGKKTFTKATAVQEDYAASLDKTADSAKKANKYLSGLDEIKTFQSEETSASSGSAGGVAVGDMFEEVEIDSKIFEVAERFKKILEPIVELFEFIGESIGDDIYLLTALGLAFGVVASILTGSFGNAILFAIGLIVLLIAHWDEIKASMESFDSWLSEVFEKDWREEFGIFGGVIEGFFDGVEDVWNGCKLIFNGINKFIEGVFAGDWEKAWEGIKEIFSGIWQALVGIVKAAINPIIGLINGLLEAVFLGLNAIIGAINDFGFTLPDWLGGVTLELPFDIPTFKTPKIPYLASGAVIPPRSEFLAVLGDQRHGNNIEAPEDLIRKIVREETAGLQSQGGGSYKFTAQINRKVLFEEFISEAKMRQMQSGKNPFELA